MKSACMASRLGLNVLCVLVLAACDLGTIDLSGPIGAPWSSLKVVVQNSGSSEFLVAFRGTTGPVAAGQRVPLWSYTSVSALPGSESFSIQRGPETLARVTFKPLRCPEKKGDTKETTILVREPSPGQFEVTAVEPDWLVVLDVTGP